MSLDLQAPANRLLALATAAGATAQLGVALAPDRALVAQITLAGVTTTLRTTGGTQVDIRYRINLLVRLAGATAGTETTAEGVLLGLVAQLLAALTADLTLAGTCHGLAIELAGGDDPGYVSAANAEYREYPLIVTCRQYGTFATNP